MHRSSKMGTSKTAEPQVKKIDGFDEWEVKNAARVLQEAFEIKNKPKLFAAALKEVNRQKKAAEDLQGWAGNLRGG